MNDRVDTNNFLRFLLIDDNPDDRVLVIHELKKEFQIHVKEIADAEGLADALEEGNFDIVITDYRLRWSNGLEVFWKIKARRPDCPVIMFTGTGNEEIAAEAMKSGLDDYVIKSQKHFKRLPAAVKVAIKEVRQRQEMKKAEAALRESEEKYRSLVESTEDSIYLVDRDCRYLFMNQKHLSRSGFPTIDRVIGKRYGELHSKEDTKEFIKRVEEVFKSGRSVSYEYRGKKDEGYFIRTLSPVTGPDGRTMSVTVVSKDITERKRLEEELIHAQKMEAMGTLAGGIAHDFNNILMGILGNASLMLLDKTSSHPNYERLKNIEQSVKSGAELSKQLLGFARGGKYEVKPTDLNELIKNETRMFGRTRKEITIRGKYEEKLWTVEVDQCQMKQVILNLYVNAWQAMPGGGDLFIQTENCNLGEDYIKPFSIEHGRYVKISIADTGVGMDEATQQRIFEPFFTTKEMGRGTGLGLASVYGIIKNHGGMINVYSEKGEGTTFTIHLPASKKRVIKEKEITGEVLMGKETVLLVDDEDMIIDVGEKILKKLGYDVITARSGKEAIELYKKNPDNIHMVVMDMIMPAMGGGETCDRLKKINPNLKVLLSSGYSINGRAREILDRCCNGFIQKPFNIRELSQEIRRILDR
ncbi:MAG TPA: response regulator [Desulfatiglandales bacterium]|nr:response regulator [Desulfatiglandales bacterium]